MDGHDSDGDGRRNGNGDGRLNGDCGGEVTKLMYSATATAMALDGATATRWRPDGNTMAIEGEMVTQQQ